MMRVLPPSKKYATLERSEFRQPSFSGDNQMNTVHLYCKVEKIGPDER